jgi:hypothetical protein
VTLLNNIALLNKYCGSGEMADALGLGPSGEIRGGSSPFSRTKHL